MKTTDTVQINLGGKDYNIVMDNFARELLAKHILEGAQPDPQSYWKKVEEMNSISTLYLLSNILYACLCANDLRKMKKPTITEEQVGEWVATADEVQLLRVYEAFKNAEGMNIKHPEKQQQSHSAKKKHPRPTKKNSKEPSEKSE